MAIVCPDPSPAIAPPWKLTRTQTVGLADLAGRQAGREWTVDQGSRVHARLRR